MGGPSEKVDIHAAKAKRVVELPVALGVDHVRNCSKPIAILLRTTACADSGVSSGRELTGHATAQALAAIVVLRSLSRKLDSCEVEQFGLDSPAATPPVRDVMLAPR